jgi:hypothetical protein
MARWLCQEMRSGFRLPVVQRTARVDADQQPSIGRESQDVDRLIDAGRREAPDSSWLVPGNVPQLQLLQAAITVRHRKVRSLISHLEGDGTSTTLDDGTPLGTPIRSVQSEHIDPTREKHQNAPIAPGIGQDLRECVGSILLITIPDGSEFLERLDNPRSPVLLAPYATVPFPAMKKTSCSMPPAAVTGVLVARS